MADKKKKMWVKVQRCLKLIFYAQVHAWSHLLLQLRVGVSGVDNKEYLQDVTHNILQMN